MLAPGYHHARLPRDERRERLWRALWRHYFSRRVAPDACVLDLGCGYGSFINTVVARRRIALDCWPDFPRHLAPGVEAIVGPAAELGALPEGGIDFALASNVFEHLPQAEFAQVLAALRPKLSRQGEITIIQPNYRFAYREYFDDYTHVAVYSDVSLPDFLVAHGYEVLEVVPRFLPLTVKSRLPVWPWLIALYLVCPFKPMGKQMLVRARPARA